MPALWLGAALGEKVGQRDVGFGAGEDFVGGQLAQVVQGVEPGLEHGARVGVMVEFVVGQQAQHGFGVVGRGEGGRGCVQPLGGVALVSDPGEFERVQRGECFGDRGARGVRVTGGGEERGDPPVLIVALQEADRADWR